MSPSRRVRDDASSGFALVEALASLVVIAMISLMLFEGIGTGARVWEVVDARQSGRDGVDGAQTALRDRLEEIYPATLYDTTPPSTDFAGARGMIVFISSPPLADRPGPLRRYTLRLDASGQLILSSVSDVAPLTDTVIDQVLLSGVRGVDVAYFGVAGSDPTAGWRPDWADQALLPQAIRIRLRFQVGDRRSWPDLIVHPRATVDTACSLDPISHDCKGR
ncbi:MAG TPA: hypothetical protein VG166_01715 [Caulobacteraceae bacterium]|nr:hypothetical protein [Caulobacteraceae bacterium]